MGSMHCSHAVSSCIALFRGAGATRRFEASHGTPCTSGRRRGAGIAAPGISAPATDSQEHVSVKSCGMPEATGDDRVSRPVARRGHVAVGAGCCRRPVCPRACFYRNTELQLSSPDKRQNGADEGGPAKQRDKEHRPRRPDRSGRSTRRIVSLMMPTSLWCSTSGPALPRISLRSLINIDPWRPRQWPQGVGVERQHVGAGPGHGHGGAGSHAPLRRVCFCHRDPRQRHNRLVHLA
ncbi:hypothetical protein VFPFJ_07253 [Purpureocillium lilacinum]|uniref:Uncharacterized protein n=1 Tax=Purpureocillium lilacinum TaxID=33203 RepID=A0A179GR82_PURLI|nr:hypothetical protein VFPFJ_07253 [Purpureocillium lilacinum]OAQ79813.1 hypothetical protein VFPBJ_05398 [Purpureocillium lilacinum]OAQ88788.1 hypothetical protein VFPFJ_07253 [Purpureocillium lilacinum]